MSTLNLKKGTGKPSGSPMTPNELTFVPTVENDKLLDVYLTNSTGTGVSELPTLDENISNALSRTSQHNDRSTPPNTVPFRGCGVDASHYVTDVAGAITAPLRPEYPWRPAYQGSVVDIPYWFQHNSSSFGGTRPALHPNVISLLTSLGRTGSNRRYGVAFGIFRITSAADLSAYPVSTVNGGTTYWSSGLTPMWPMPARGSYAMWVKAETGNIIVRATHVNGVLVSSNENTYTNVPLTPADGWTHIHVAMVYKANYTYMFRIWSSESAVALMALPYSGTSICHILPEYHAGPIA